MFNIISHWEMQIKTTRYHHTPIRMDKIKSVTLANAGKDAETLDHSCIAGGM